MSSAALEVETREIVVDELFPHAPEMVWKTLTTPELMGRWLMAPTGFEPVPGACFTYQTTPAGKWDGVIRCQVIEAVPNERLTYTWQGGDDANAGYGSRLDTVVTWTLTAVDGGTRLRLVHSGFDAQRNDHALRKMSDGWPKVVHEIGALTKGTN
jgi:uncharacterized protein YndB with AHSA1/START domain